MEATLRAAATAPRLLHMGRSSPPMMRRSSPNVRRVQFHSESEIEKFKVKDPVFLVSQREKPLPLKLINFKEPGSYSEVIENLSRNRVMLTKAEAFYTYLEGTLLVSNLSYQKKVIIHYTFNDWEITKQMEARYSAEQLDHSRSSDRFDFTIEFHENSFATLQFAIKYQVNGEIFWDNNNCKNYVVQGSSPKPPKITFKPSSQIKPCQKKSTIFDRTTDKNDNKETQTTIKATHPKPNPTSVNLAYLLSCAQAEPRNSLASAFMTAVL